MARDWTDSSGISRQAEKLLAPQIREPDDPDVEESPGGDGRSVRHQTFSFMVETDDRELWIVPYSEIRFQKLGRVGGTSASFHFEDADGEPVELVLKGEVESLRKMLDRISGGRRELIRPSPDAVSSITFRKVEDR